YASMLHEDLRIRRMVKQKLYHAGVSNIEIERSGNQIKLHISTARPGIIIGRKGAEVDKLKSELDAQTRRQVQINIKEVRKPELDAQ
ncbi:MAG: 30S ribosomal protein S3, partial [Candidatus Latescibacteria bacterium]|nr:30S ribosomal protein S3 [Candidatus Latescibacterota bacterium]